MCFGEEAEDEYNKRKMQIHMKMINEWEELSRSSGGEVGKSSIMIFIFPSW